MSNPRRSCFRVLGAAAGLAIASAALAAPGTPGTPGAPAALDRVRADAGAILAVDSLRAFDQNLSQLLASIEFDVARSLREFMNVMGIGDGVNMDGSAALVWPPGADFRADLDRAVMLIPTTPDARFLTSLKAQPDGPEGDVQRIDYNGRVYYARQLEPAIVIVGLARAPVAAFSLDTDQLPRRLASAGPRGRAVIERADLVLVADQQSVRPVMNLVMTPIRQGLTALGAATDPQFVAAQLALADDLIQRIEVQSRLAVVGLSTTALGAQVDLVTPFIDGSEMHELCSAPVDHTNPLRALPTRDYLFTATTHLAHPAIRSLLDEALKDAAEQARDNAPPTATHSTMALSMLRAMDHGATAIYLPDGPILTTGALTRTLVTWTSPNPSDAADTFKRMIDASGATGEGGSSFLPNTLTLAGSPVDNWAVWPSPAVTTNHHPMLTGTAPGVRGFSAVRASRGFITVGQDQGVLAEAMRDNGPPQPLAEDLMIVQISEMLPANPTLRWFLNIKPVITQFGPMITALTRTNLEMPAQMPPIGSAMTMADGALHAGLYIPAPFLKVAATLYRAQQSNPE